MFSNKSFSSSHNSNKIDVNCKRKTIHKLSRERFITYFLRPYSQILKNHKNMDPSDEFNLIDDLTIILNCTLNRRKLQLYNPNFQQVLFENIKANHFPNKKISSIIDRNNYYVAIPIIFLKELVNIVNIDNIKELGNIETIFNISNLKGKIDETIFKEEKKIEKNNLIEMKRGRSLNQLTQTNKKINLLKETQKKQKKTRNLKRLSYTEFNIFNKENKKNLILNENMIKNQNKTIPKILILEGNKENIHESDLTIEIKKKFNEKEREINDYMKDCKELIDFLFDKYRLKTNEILKILDSANGKAGRAIEFIENRNYKLIWSEDEDDVLINSKTLDDIGIKLLIKYKGIDEVKLRCNYKKLELEKLFI